jgi:signal transduction histidine kinase
MTDAERILIIDDEALFRMSLRALLEDLGYEVHEAGNGREGLEACASLRPDLVLLDIRMPDLGGVETCARLKQDEALKEIPVIFLSGLLHPEEKIQAFQAGAVDYITKPYHIEEVQARLRVHLAIRRQRAALEQSHDQLEQSLFETQVLNEKLIEINERLARSESLKSNFIAHMRNELNNPLTAIMGLAEEIAQSGGSSVRVGQMAWNIRAEAFHLDFHLRNVFCAADLEAGELVPGYALVDIGSVIRDVADSQSPACAQKSLTVKVGVDETGGPLRFPTDAAFLNVIVANLLANAIEFSPEGGLVELQAHLEEDTLALSVRDQGPGIAVSDHSAIFDRFRQLETGPTRSHAGQGLGLSVVKALAELMDGEIRVDSDPGRGSEFALCLPRPTLFEDLGTSAFDGNLFLFGDPEER